jgi:hypothetical protein
VVDEFRWACTGPRFAADDRCSGRVPAALRLDLLAAERFPCEVVIHTYRPRRT